MSNNTKPYKFKPGSRDTTQLRLTEWQRKELTRISETTGVPLAKINRYALNTFLINFNGQINRDMVDESQLAAWTRVNSARVAACIVNEKQG